MKASFARRIVLKVGYVLLVIIAVVLYLYSKQRTMSSLKINEIAFSLDNGVDWIEIYNPTMNNLSIEDFYLSDRDKDFSKFRIKEEVIVPANGFVVVYCDGYEGDTTNSTVTNFRISVGETIYLVSKDGSTVIDSVPAVVEDPDITEISVGRYPDGGDEVFMMAEYTPGEANKKGL